MIFENNKLPAAESMCEIPNYRPSTCKLYRHILPERLKQQPQLEPWLDLGYCKYLNSIADSSIEVSNSEAITISSGNLFMYVASRTLKARC